MCRNWPGAEPRIVERISSVNDVTLAFVVLRHLPAAGSKTRAQVFHNAGVAFERTAQRFCHALTSKVVFSGTETAHEDNDIRGGECYPGHVDQISTAIAHDGLKAYFHAQPVQLRSEEERVRVLAERSQQLRSNGNER